VSRTYARASTSAGPTRLAPRKPALFDLTPDDDQQLIVDVVHEIAAEVLRPAAADADVACATPLEVLASAAQLGLTLLEVPEDLGGLVRERSTTTGVLVAEALAHGDLGMGAACMAPASVATALSLWGDAGHGMRIGTDGVQLLGGHGFVKEHPVERWYRDLRAIGVLEGGLLV
jgi:alkylation response protein AidB-like acyl-CoA dehydrogenase